MSGVAVGFAAEYPSKPPARSERDSSSRLHRRAGNSILQFWYALQRRVVLHWRLVMARQRFIWPTIWKDPVFGRLSFDEQVLFIGLFSIADDEGRLLADPAYLRSELFTYKNFSEAKVTRMRDDLAEKCANVHLYEVGGTPYVALLKWGSYQRPKYPKPSSIPPPTLGEDSSSVGVLGWDGLDRDGLGGVGLDRGGKGRAPSADASGEQQGDKSPFQPPTLKDVA